MHGFATGAFHPLAWPPQGPARRVCLWPPGTLSSQSNWLPERSMAWSSMGDQSATELGALALVNATRLHGDPHSSGGSQGRTLGQGLTDEAEGAGLQFPHL